MSDGAILTDDAARMAIPADALPLRCAPGLDLLDGMVVLDLTTSIAGPYAGQLLADMGATVLKVERPGGGDDARAWGPPFLDGESLWFLSVNRNKQSIAIDQSDPRGRALVRRLAASADIVLVNLVARAQAKLGIDHATLSADNPGLIHVSITGFGLAGERADRPCYDLIAEGYSGVMDMTGEPGAMPQKVGAPAADMLAGQDAAMAALAAVVRRQRTGIGCAIDVALVDSMVRFMAPRLSPYLGSGERLTRSGGRDSVIAIYQAFDTADEPMTLALGNDAIWRRFWAEVGEPGYAMRPEFASNADRRRHRTAIVDKIAAILVTRPREEWLDRLRVARVPAGPINRLDEVAADPALQVRGLFYAIERDGARVPQIGLGIGFDRRTEGSDRPPPRLGGDGAAILSDRLGLSADEIETLRRDGII